MAENGVKSEPMADSPTSVLDEEDRSEDNGETALKSKRGRGSKTKDASSYGNRKAKRAVAAMLTRSKDDGSIDWNISAK